MMKKIVTALFLLPVLLSLNAQGTGEKRLEDMERNKSTQEINTSATLTSATRLFKNPDDLTSVIMVIPRGEICEVLNSDSTYLHVLYEEYEGYILKRHAKVEKPAVEAAKAEDPVPAVTVKETQPEPEQQVGRFAYLERKYGTSMAARINSGKIWKGMNAEMIKDSWGKPERISREISGNNVKEEWFYRTTWLYLENNTLKGWGPLRK